MNLKSARGRPPAGTEVDTRPSRPAATDLCIVLPSRRLSPDPLPECALNVQSLLAKSMTSGTLLLVLLFSACSENLLLSYGDDTNFLLFDHPNSEKAIADVRARAEALCAGRKQLAVKTESVCSLSNCTTNYQCMDKAGVARDAH